MNNKSVSDFVAAAMNAVLESDDHKSLFGSTYKKASWEVCPKCKEVGEPDMTNACKKCGANFPKKDSDNADTNFAKDEIEDESSADDDADDNDSDDVDADESNANDNDVDADECSADDEKISSAFDIAIDGLLTASAALDSVGFEKSSTLSLKIASFVVEAKKKEKANKDKKKSKKPNPFAKKKDNSSSSKSSKKPAKKDEKKSGKSSSTSSSKKPAKKDDKKSSSKK